MDSKKILNIAIILVISIISFLIGSYNINKTDIYNAGSAEGYSIGYDEGYTSAWNKATERIDSSEFPIFPAPSEMLQIQGTIKNISSANKSLTIEAMPISQNPLSNDSKTTTRQVIIDIDTKIIERLVASQEEIQKMMDESKNNPETFDYSQPFPPFTEQEIDFDKLKVEDEITVFANKNIKNELNILAEKIEILER